MAPRTSTRMRNLRCSQRTRSTLECESQLPSVIRGMHLTPTSVKARRHRLSPRKVPHENHWIMWTRTIIPWRGVEVVTVCISPCRDVLSSHLEVSTHLCISAASDDPCGKHCVCTLILVHHCFVLMRKRRSLSLQPLHFNSPTRRLTPLHGERSIDRSGGLRSSVLAFNKVVFC